jgi:two-component system NtrC family sensor kinase
VLKNRFSILKYIFLWIGAFALYYSLWDICIDWYEYANKTTVVRQTLRQIYWIRGVSSTFLFSFFALVLFYRFLERKFREHLRDKQASVLEKFSAHVAHEIRNPLTSLSLNAELVQAEIKNAGRPGGEECIKLTDAINQEVARLAKTTEAYLNFRNKLPKHEVFGVSKVVDEVTDEFELALKDDERTIRFEKNIKTTSSIEGDRQRLKVLMVQLIRNALEAMPNGGVIEIYGSKKWGHYCLTVRDSGVGMSRDVYSNLFEPFYTTKLKGSGMGLALVRQILKEFQASIRCRTYLGRGTSFQIYFPLVK